MQAILQELFWTYLAIVSRYLLLGGIFFLVFYKIFRTRFSYRKIQLKFPNSKDYYRELGYSLLAVWMMAATSIPFFIGSWEAYNQIVYTWSELPMWYHLLCFPIMMVLHDTYFYWMHRMLHHPRIFKIAHLVHHRSTNPSPWAAYSFHPIEAFFESLIGPIILLIMPVHIGLFIGFFIFQIVYNIYGHSGFEFFPKGFDKHWLGRWINTSVHHNLHHKYFNNSYGLYFTMWDRWMGTMHPKYEKTYMEVTNRKILSNQKKLRPY